MFPDYHLTSELKDWYQKAITRNQFFVDNNCESSSSKSVGFCLQIGLSFICDLFFNCLNFKLNLGTSYIGELIRGKL